MVPVKRYRVPEHIRQRFEHAAQEQEYRAAQKARTELTPHRVLIPALIEVIKRDDSLSKLYAGLLAKQVITHSPQLRREYAQQLAEVLERDEKA
jgi:hypothetical protein